MEISDSIIESMVLGKKQIPENFSDDPSVEMEFMFHQTHIDDTIFFSATVSHKNDDDIMVHTQSFLISMTPESFKRFCKMATRFDERIS